MPKAGCFQEELWHFAPGTFRHAGHVVVFSSEKSPWNPSIFLELFSSTLTLACIALPLTLPRCHAPHYNVQDF